MAKTRLVTFVVEGQGYFPFDMLRYDGCYPRRTEDAINLAGETRRKIELAIRILSDMNPNRVITEERWRSFGWSVVSGSIQKFN